MTIRVIDLRLGAPTGQRGQCGRSSHGKEIAPVQVPGSIMCSTHSLLLATGCAAATVGAGWAGVL